MPADKGTGSRNRRPKPRPEDIHDRPTAITPRQQYEQAQERRAAAEKTPKGATARQRSLIADKKARSRANYRSDVARQVANPSIADRLAGGFFRQAASGLGTAGLVDDAVWSFTHPIERVTERGRAAGPDMMIWPGMGKTVAQPIRTPGEQVFAAMPEARKLRAKQEAGYSKARSERIREADEIFESMGGDITAHFAAKRALAGELPKLRFKDMEGVFDENAVRDMFREIHAHPGLRKYERVRARDAILKAADGVVPQRSEIALLEKVFGPATVEDLSAAASRWQKAQEGFYNVINIPRALKSSFDLSAPFRQGLVLGARHPVIWSRSWGPMLKAARREGAYEDFLNEILERPTYERMRAAKLAITDLEGGLTKREEAFMSNAAEKLTGGKRSPVRASGRAYTTFLNKLRADAFDNYLQVAAEQGLDIAGKTPESKRLLNSIAEAVNNMTGRGGHSREFSLHVAGLNALLFSPRLMASRLNHFNPSYYKNLHPFARKQAAQGILRLAGAVSMTLYLAKLAGADVNLDPRNSDFGKIRIGDTRIDIAGGFLQYLTVASRLASGEYVSSATGEVTPLGSDFGETSTADILERFGRQKMAPVPAYVYDLFKGQTFEGDDFHPAKEAGRLLLPIGFESTYDTYQSQGRGPAAVGFGLNGVGFGVQTYGAEKKKSSKSRSKPSGRSSRRRRPKP